MAPGQFAAAKKRKMSTVLLAQQQSYREAQVKGKEARANRSSSLLAQHRHVLEMVAMYMNLDYRDIEDGVLDADIHIKLLDSLFAVGGRKAVLIFYSEMDLPSVESGRLISLPKDSKMWRAIVSTGKDVEASGTCVIAYRVRNSVHIEVKRIYTEIHFSSFFLDPEETNTICVVNDMLRKVREPVVTRTKIWGDLVKTPAGVSKKDDFLRQFQDFVTFLLLTKTDLAGKVKFETPESLWVGILSTHTELMASLGNSDIVKQVEAVVRTWGKQIKQVLTQSDHLRQERDDIGPLVELHHWRRLLAKFTSIIEHLKSHKCKNYIQYLIQSKSKLIKKWRVLDNRITDATNEAADNVKYLYSLQKYCMPLYFSEPNDIVHHIPKLMYAIRNGVFNFIVLQHH
ncbi:hypothetical protein L9F63_014128 [Diploptera punctata]|uniref:Dynein heavy chain tail domain-containing protein n=1 Tax=Diploptera punctata TaxID=6984 RepID=A0AAD8AAN5_DIPPU|nr:hypothetical protein L9F63_014128 [Diploptera punctata]